MSWVFLRDDKMLWSVLVFLRVSTVYLPVCCVCEIRVCAGGSHNIRAVLMCTTGVGGLYQCTGGCSVGERPCVLLQVCEVKTDRCAVATEKAHFLSTRMNHLVSVTAATGATCQLSALPQSALTRADLTGVETDEVWGH